MLSPKDVQRVFRAGAWTTPQEIEAFVQEAGPLPASELVKLVAVLLDRAVSSPAPQAHASRCLAFARLAEVSGDPEVFRLGVKGLRTADATTATMLVALLPKINQVSAHAELCQLLGVPDEGVRRAAAAVLRQVAGKSAFESLAELCRSPDFTGRIDTMDVLVPKAGHHAIPLLTIVLRHGKPAEKAHALRYLTDPRFMGKDPAAAVRAVAMALEDADERVVAQAVAGLPAIASEDDFVRLVGPRLESQSAALAKATLEGFKKYKSPRAAEYLSARFIAGPNAIRLLVLEAAAAIGDEKVLDLLAMALTHRSAPVRAKASEVLSQLAIAGKIDSAQTVVWLFRSRDPGVQRLAAEIIEKAGQSAEQSSELAPRLLALLRTEDWWVRERVMDSLVATMPGPVLARHLAPYLNDERDVIRRFAIAGLSRLRDPRTIGSFVRTALNDADWWVREKAIEAIAELADKRAIPYILEILQRHPEQRLVSIQALRALQASEASEHVAPFLADDDADVRLAAIECLGALDAQAHGPALRALENDKVFRVRTAARELIQRWKVPGEGAVADDKHLNLLDRLLTAVMHQQADDLVLAAGRQPYVKRLGGMEPLSKTVLSEEQVRAILFPHMTAPQLEQLEGGSDVDFSYEVMSRGLRFRGHVFRQNTGIGAVFRIVKSEIMNVDALGLPPIVKTFADMRSGLVLVGGPTGAGKSTTLAAIIDQINRTHAYHIVSIEDPIEVVHARKLSLVNQREVGTHTPAFAVALRSTLRQDPDVLLVGELRDLDTISLAVSAAETGHLVFGTVHTVSADTSIERIINAFPAGQQPQVRSMLAETLRAVVCQHLLRRADGHGRVLAVEVLLNNDAVSNMIRKGKTFQIPTVVQSSRDAGMQSMDSDLIRLVKAGLVAPEEGYAKANDKKSFEAAVNPPKPGAPEPNKSIAAVPQVRPSRAASS